MDPEAQKKLARLAVNERLRRFYNELRSSCSDVERYVPHNLRSEAPESGASPS